MQHDPEVDRRHVQRRGLRYGADHCAASHHLQVGGVKGFVADLDATWCTRRYHASGRSCSSEHDPSASGNAASRIALICSGRCGLRPADARYLRLATSTSCSASRTPISSWLCLALFNASPEMSSPVSQRWQRRGRRVELFDQALHSRGFNRFDAGVSVILNAGFAGNGGGDDNGHENIAEMRGESHLRPYMTPKANIPISRVGQWV